TTRYPATLALRISACRARCAGQFSRTGDATSRTAYWWHRRDAGCSGDRPRGSVIAPRTRGVVGLGQSRGRVAASETAVACADSLRLAFLRQWEPCQFPASRLI